MARYRASIDIQQPREGVFAYPSDFSTTSPAILGVSVGGHRADPSRRSGDGR